MNLDRFGSGCGLLVGGWQEILIHSPEVVRSKALDTIGWSSLARVWLNMIEGDRRASCGTDIGNRDRVANRPVRRLSARRLSGHVTLTSKKKSHTVDSHGEVEGPLGPGPGPGPGFGFGVAWNRSNPC
jgi:hypothetical protein